MHTLGYNPLSKHDCEYVNTYRNEDITEYVKDIGSKRRKWFEENFKEDFEENFMAENNLSKFSDSLSDFMVYSKSLCNASHYDIDDESISVCT